MTRERALRQDLVAARLAARQFARLNAGLTARCRELEAAATALPGVRAERDRWQAEAAEATRLVAEYMMALAEANGLLADLQRGMAALKAEAVALVQQAGGTG